MQQQTRVSWVLAWMLVASVDCAISPYDIWKDAIEAKDADACDQAVKNQVENFGTYIGSNPRWHKECNADAFKCKIKHHHPDNKTAPECFHNLEDEDHNPFHSLDQYRKVLKNYASFGAEPQHTRATKFKAYCWSQDMSKDKWDSKKYRDSQTGAQKECLNGLMDELFKGTFPRHRNDCDEYDRRLFECYCNDAALSVLRQAQEKRDEMIQQLLDSISKSRPLGVGSYLRYTGIREVGVTTTINNHNAGIGAYAKDHTGAGVSVEIFSTLDDESTEHTPTPPGAGIRVVDGTVQILMDSEFKILKTQVADTGGVVDRPDADDAKPRDSPGPPGHRFDHRSKLEKWFTYEEVFPGQGPEPRVSLFGQPVVTKYLVADVKAKAGFSADLRALVAPTSVTSGYRFELGASMKFTPQQHELILGDAFFKVRMPSLMNVQAGASLTLAPDALKAGVAAHWALTEATIEKQLLRFPLPGKLGQEYDITLKLQGDICAICLGGRIQALYDDSSSDLSETRLAFKLKGAALLGFGAGIDIKIERKGSSATTGKKGLLNEEF